jgi:hypothetical protein
MERISVPRSFCVTQGCGPVTVPETRVGHHAAIRLRNRQGPIDRIVGKRRLQVPGIDHTCGQSRIKVGSR